MTSETKSERLHYELAERLFEETLAPRGLKDRPPGLEHRDLLIEAIQIGIAAGHVEAGSALPRSNPFTAVIRGMGDKGRMDTAEEPWLGAGQKGDCGLLLDLGETQVFVPADPEICRGLPFEKPLRARIVFEPDVEQEPLPPNPPLKESQRRFVLVRRFVDRDGDRTPLIHQTGQLIIGCDRCRTTSHFVVVGVLFGDSPHELTVITHMPLGWVERDGEDLCPRCSEQSQPQNRKDCEAKGEG